MRLHHSHQTYHYTRLYSSRTSDCLSLVNSGSFFFFVQNRHGISGVNKRRQDGSVSDIDGLAIYTSSLLCYKSGPPIQHCIWASKKHSIASFAYDIPFDVLQHFDCTYLSYCHDDFKRQIDVGKYPKPSTIYIHLIAPEILSSAASISLHSSLTNLLLLTLLKAVNRDLVPIYDAIIHIRTFWFYRSCRRGSKKISDPHLSNLS